MYTTEEYGNQLDDQEYQIRNKQLPKLLNCWFNFKLPFSLFLSFLIHNFVMDKISLLSH